MQEKSVSQSRQPLYNYWIQNWKSYNLDIVQEDMLALLNILESYGKDLDCLHASEGHGFCGLFNPDGYLNDAEIAHALLNCNTFFTEARLAEHKKFMLEEWLADDKDDYDAAEQFIENWESSLIPVSDGWVEQHIC